MDYRHMSIETAQKFRQYAVRQRKINAYQMPLCIGHYRKIENDNSSWELYYDTKYKLIVSIAKPGSGAMDSFWACGLDEIRRRVYDGRIKEKNLTKYGRRLLGLN